MANTSGLKLEYARIFGWDLALFSAFGVMGLLDLVSRISTGNWEIATKGHWRDGPYLVFGVILLPYVTFVYFKRIKTFRLVSQLDWQANFSSSRDTSYFKQVNGATLVLSSQKAYSVDGNDIHGGSASSASLVILPDTSVDIAKRISPLFDSYQKTDVCVELIRAKADLSDENFLRKFLQEINMALGETG